MQIVKYTKEHKEGLEELLKTLSKEDRYFLALDCKRDVIRMCMRKERHIFVLLKEGDLIGFLRESGRPDGYTMLEEFVIKKEYRGYGYGSLFLDFFKSNYEKAYVKTNGKNDAMNQLLKKKDYRHVSGVRIMNWQS